MLNIIYQNTKYPKLYLPKWACNCAAAGINCSNARSPNQNQ